MQDLLSSGQIVDLIFILMGVEAAGLIALWILAGRGVKPGPLLANLAAGGCLLLALRAAIRGGSPTLLAGLLALSFAAHLFDIWFRWTAAPLDRR